MDYWDLPQQKGAVSKRELKEVDGPQVQSIVYNHGTVKPGSNVFGWVSINRIDVYETVGEHVAGYDKAYRFAPATAPTWGRCIEAHDWSGKGPLWGLEVDLFSVGVDPTSTRRGIGVVYGTTNGGQRATHDIGVHVLPNNFDPASARLRCGFRVDGDVENGLEIPGGSAIKVSDDPAVPVLRFDPATGFVGLWKGRLCVWGCHAVSGEVVSMRTF